MKRSIAAVAAVLCALALPARAAESCRLVQIAAFDLTRTADGTYTIPLSLSRRTLPFIVEFAMSFSGIRGSTADVRLRSSVLSQLHLYFAFKEKMLYVTSSDS